MIWKWSFPTVTNICLFQDHLLSKALFQKTSIATLQSSPLSKWSATSRCLPSINLPTRRTLHLGRPDAMNTQVSPQCNGWTSYHFKIIFKVWFYWLFKSSVFQDSWTITMQCLFPSVTDKQPFQDHLSRITLTPLSCIGKDFLSFHCNIPIWLWSIHIYYCYNCVSNHVYSCVTVHIFNISY